MVSEKQQGAVGCLFGLAFGDALGADTEFMRINEILERYPPHGPDTLQGNPARVTDDTQMTISVGNALLHTPRPYNATTLEQALRKEFIAWNRSPDNNRAPGLTCIRACDHLEKGYPWHKSTVSHSKGCGANMRVAPVGLLLSETIPTRAALAQFQAALTHGHPTALAASDLTAYAITSLLEGIQPTALPAHLRTYALAQRTTYHEEWLGSLWQQVVFTTPQEFIAHGWDECLDVLKRLDKALQIMDRAQDPCQATGEGWIAEEALATSLLCFLLYPDEPIKAIQRAATTAGDSDSIACLTGAFAGAYLGHQAWPQAWYEQIEYKDQLRLLAETLH